MWKFNFDSNNKLLFVDEPDLADRPWQRETGGELGRPLRYEFDGVFRSQSEIDSESLDYSAIAPLLKPGDARVVDINGDGKLTKRELLSGKEFTREEVKYILQLGR